MQSRQVISRTSHQVVFCLCDTNIVDTVHCAVISFMAMVLWFFLLEVEGGHRGHGSSLCVVMIQRGGAESLGSISFVLSFSVLHCLKVPLLQEKTVTDTACSMDVPLPEG